MNKTFEKLGFYPADILLPKDADMTKSGRGGLRPVHLSAGVLGAGGPICGGRPSTLRLILPESKLESDNVDEEIQKINATMEQYLQEERLRPVEDAMIFVERKLANRQDPPGPAGQAGPGRVQL